MTRDDDDGSRCPVIINFCATTMNEWKEMTSSSTHETNNNTHHLTYQISGKLVCACQRTTSCVLPLTFKCVFTSYHFEPHSSWRLPPFRCKGWARHELLTFVFVFEHLFFLRKKLVF
jgi:hypothetical protein